jgi:hypothetical protein
VWCTFGPQQIDINPFSEPGEQFLSLVPWWQALAGT